MTTTPAAGAGPSPTFWDHLEALRSVLLRLLALIAIVAIVCFCFKSLLFDGIILAPQRPSFPTYRLIGRLAALFGIDASFPPIPLINTAMTRQLFVHMTMSLWMALLITSPYIIYSLFHFLAPALYTRERQLALRLLGGGYALFLIGVLISYFLIFPIAFRFLSTYQVSPQITNLITLQSYVDTLCALTLLMGLLFELPILCLLLSKAGIINRSLMARFRRHALVVILIAAAVITPTTDPFTLLLVALPVYLLYELSIRIVPR